MADGGQQPKKKDKQRRALEKLMPDIKIELEAAVQFLTSEFGDDFEKADRYYNGKVDIPQQEQRSGVVATPVRDSIRAFRPSIMRVLASNRNQIVKYKPSNIKQAPVTDQQTKYAHQVFWENGGYMVLYSAVDESLRHKFSPVKTYWAENPTPVYTGYTMMTQEDVNLIRQQPDVTITKVIPSSPPLGMKLQAPLFDIELMTSKSNGAIRMEAVPYTEFFISQNAHDVSDATVHGHQRVVTVGEAKELGIDFDDWASLPEYTEEEEIGSSNDQERRGYPLKSENTSDKGLGKKILLTEAFVRADLHDAGFTQLYCLYLSGKEYELLDYYRDHESPFDLLRHDPIPFTPVGYSVFDVVGDTQDVMTSMLRGMVDNVHLANTPRLAANPQQVNMDDLLNFTVGHPIRLKAAGATVQVISIPSQLQQTLPMLQWLETDSENKIGVTKAAQGLDPSAMQSTDKDAVKNTIALSQGQVELAVRNIIETGVIPMFRKILRLSIEHMDRFQVVRSGGMVVPIDQMLLDPDMYAEPCVGLGSASDEAKMAGLQSTVAQQIQIINMLGIANPFVGAHHVYNALEDLTIGFGLENVGRYYNYVDMQAEQAFAAQKKQEEADKAKDGKPIDPGLALVQAEQVKSQTKQMTDIISARTDALRLKFESLKAIADDDFRRDQMEQELWLSVGKIFADTGVKLDDHEIKRDQAMPRPPSADIETVATSADQGLPQVPQFQPPHPQPPPLPKPDAGTAPPQVGPPPPGSPPDGGGLPNGGEQMPPPPPPPDGGGMPQ